MCRIARLFLLQKLQEVCQATRAISTTSRREVSSSFSSLQGKAQMEIHAILRETLGDHAPSYATFKSVWPNLNVVIFPPVLRLVLNDPKQWSPRRLLMKFMSYSWKSAGFPKINSWATRYLTWACWVHHSWRFWHAEALREVGPEMPERGSKTSTVPLVWATFGILSAPSKWFLVSSRLVTMNETWLYNNYPETRLQSME